MPASIESPLRCHPATPCAPVRSLAASARLAADGVLDLRYALRAAPAAIYIPAAQPPGAADGLWQHTCCEAFIAAVDGQNYREFNFSPSGQWAAYRFVDYRERDSGFVPPVAPQLVFHRLADGFRLTARIPPELLPPARTFQIGLCAVIETIDGSKSYWALAHAAAQPDFHRRQSFTLTLDRP